jgi:hypothetical protein
MSHDDLLIAINQARLRINDPDFSPTEQQVRAGVLLYQQLRTRRTNTVRKTTAKKEAAPKMTLADMLKSLDN